MHDDYPKNGAHCPVGIPGAMTALETSGMVSGDAPEGGPQARAVRDTSITETVTSGIKDRDRHSRVSVSLLFMSRAPATLTTVKSRLVKISRDFCF
jgi:hypothetical protein